LHVVEACKEGGGGRHLSDYMGRESGSPEDQERKEYRNEVLDNRIRAQRTAREARMISEVKSFGVSTPLVYFVNQENFEIYLQYVGGMLVRDLHGVAIVKLCERIGRMVGILHKNGVMHGDLTTSNFILSHGRLVILDFGLAQHTERVEDHAIDLRLFKEVLNSAHASIVDSAWRSFLRGLRQFCGHAEVGTGSLSGLGD